MIPLDNRFETVCPAARVRCEHVIEGSVFADDQDDVLDGSARRAAPIFGLIRVRAGSPVRQASTAPLVKAAI